MGVRLCDNEGKVANAQMQADERIGFHSHRVELLRQKLGLKHDGTLRCMDELARLLNDRGRSREAELLYREVLETRQATWGMKHPGTLVTLNFLGMLLKANHKYGEAE